MACSNPVGGKPALQKTDVHVSIGIHQPACIMHPESTRANKKREAPRCGAAHKSEQKCAIKAGEVWKLGKCGIARESCVTSGKTPPSPPQRHNMSRPAWQTPYRHSEMIVVYDKLEMQPAGFQSHVPGTSEIATKSANKVAKTIAILMIY
jgi:hypothetical protein